MRKLRRKLVELDEIHFGNGELVIGSSGTAIALPGMLAK